MFRRLFSSSATSLRELSELTALSPIDGRYARHTLPLRDYFSEFALIQRRATVEVRWFQYLSQQPTPLFPDSNLHRLSPADHAFLDDILASFTLADAQRVKTIEKTTNHDLKSVEYFLKERLQQRGASSLLPSCAEYIHFGCTSEDINNLSYALMLRDAQHDLFLPEMDAIISQLITLSDKYAEVAMLSRTHGQPATPTTLGKEVANFAYRLSRQRAQYERAEVLGKLNGAVGNHAALSVVLPAADWQGLSRGFITGRLRLGFSPYTTQIEPHDFIAEHCDALSRFNNVLLDLSRDLWGYISLGYFTQKLVAAEVGSSTMPHKINPIDFENCEGNLGIANALFHQLRSKLTQSRFQRDLSDSTTLRSLGSAYGHTLIAFASLKKGLSRIEVNKEAVLRDLNSNVEVLAEPIQMVLRTHARSSASGAAEVGPYERLKELTRGKKLSLEQLREFIQSLGSSSSLPDEERRKLLDLTPEKYIGQSARLARREVLTKYITDLSSKRG